MICENCKQKEGNHQFYFSTGIGTCICKLTCDKCFDELLNKYSLEYDIKKCDKCDRLIQKDKQYCNNIQCIVNRFEEDKILTI